MNDPEFDFIVVGAGSAGCAVANRLTADGANSVLLLEAGGDDRLLHNPAQTLTNIGIAVPGAVAQVLRDPRVVWPYTSQPDPDSGGRTHLWPRGRVLGGSSSINGMIYSRGQPSDYDGWRDQGCTGWGWTDVLPYFRRFERLESRTDRRHGPRNLLAISQVRALEPVSRAAIAAFVEAGVPQADNVDGATQEGVKAAEITATHGRRNSTSAAYLWPALRRPNLRLETHAFARRVLFTGLRVTGLEYDRYGQLCTARARREVILCAGVINSPQLLELSGVGDARRLSDLGISVTAENSQVGENLQDHYNVQMQFRLKPGVSSLNAMKRPLPRAAAVARYVLLRKGALAEGPSQVTAYVRTVPGSVDPDVRFLVMPLTMKLSKRPSGEVVIELDDEPGLSITTCQLRPESRGSIHLLSPDPIQAPAIVPRYLSTNDDRRAIVEALKFGLHVARQSALAPFIGHRLLPNEQTRTDADLLAYALQMGGSGFHPVGTCHMGSDASSVVDPQLRVRGVTGLRVVDASIMPSIVSGNTNGPTVMIAEKAVDLICGKTGPSANSEENRERIAS